MSRLLLVPLAIATAACHSASQPSNKVAKPELRAGTVLLADVPFVDNEGRDIGDEIVNTVGVIDSALDGDRVVALLESVTSSTVVRYRFAVSGDRGATWTTATKDLGLPWWTAGYGGVHAWAGRTTVLWSMTDGQENWVQLQDVDPLTGSVVSNPALDGQRWPLVGEFVAVPGAILNVFDFGDHVLFTVYDMTTGTMREETVPTPSSSSGPRQPAGEWATIDGNVFWGVGGFGCATRLFRDNSRPAEEHCLPNLEAFPDWTGSADLVLPEPIPQAIMGEHLARSWSRRLDVPPANPGQLGDLGARVGVCSNLRRLAAGLACTDASGRFLGAAADGSFVDVRLPPSPCDSETCGQEWRYDGQVALGGDAFVVFRAVNDYPGAGMHWSAYASRETAVRAPWRMAVRTHPDAQERPAPALFAACTAAQHCFGQDVDLATCLRHWTADVPFDSPSYAAFVAVKRDDCEAVAAAWPDQGLLSAYAAGRATCAPGCAGDAMVAVCRGQPGPGGNWASDVVYDCAALGGRCVDGACAVQGASACREAFSVQSLLSVEVGCQALGMTCRPAEAQISEAPCQFQGCANTCEGSVRVRCDPGRTTSTKLDCAAFGSQCVASGNSSNCIPNISPNRWGHCDGQFLWESGEAGYFLDCRTLGGTLCTSTGTGGPHCL